MRMAERIINRIHEIALHVEDDLLDLDVEEDLYGEQLPTLPGGEYDEAPVEPLQEVPAKPTPLHEDKIKRQQMEAQEQETETLPAFDSSGIDLGTIAKGGSVLDSLLAPKATG